MKTGFYFYLRETTFKNCLFFLVFSTLRSVMPTIGCVGFICESVTI